MRDLHNNLKFELLLAPDTITGDTYSNSMDLLGYKSAELVICFGDASNTLGASSEVSWDVLIYESDDDSAYTVVTNTDDLLVGANSNVSAPDSYGVIATLDNDGDQDKLLRVGYVGSKRYIKVKLDENGDSGDCDFTIIGIRGHADEAPCDDTAAEINL